MNRQRRVFSLSILTFLLCGGPTASASAGATAKAQAGFTFTTGEAVEVDFPGSASASDSFMDSGDGTGYSTTAFASPAMRLSVSATVTGWSNISPKYSAGASVTATEDTTFNYQPDYTGAMDDYVEVALTGLLAGTITGSGYSPNSENVGSARASVLVAISGPTYNAHPDEGGQRENAIINTDDFGGIVARGETLGVNEFVSTGSVWVPRGEPVGLSISLFVEVTSYDNPFGTQSSQHGTVNADFSNTFEFNPYEFFDIRTPGVTANSPTLGLVNNQLVAFIPEPASAVMWGLGAGLAYVLRRRLTT